MTGTGTQKAAATVAKVAGLGMLACAACCALPFAIPAVALAGSGSLLAWFAGPLPWLGIVAAAALAAAWAWVGIQAHRSRRRVARSTLASMTGLTVLTGAVLAWSQMDLQFSALLGL